MKERTPGDNGDPLSMLFQKARLPGRNVPMDMLVSGLETIVRDRPIIDKTGLSGLYDFDLIWRLDVQAGGGAITVPFNADQPDIFTAVQEQLGLRLEGERGPADVIVVDGAGKPSEN